MRLAACVLRSLNRSAVVVSEKDRITANYTLHDYRVNVHCRDIRIAATPRGHGEDGRRHEFSAGLECTRGEVPSVSVERT